MITIRGYKLLCYAGSLPLVVEETLQNVSLECGAEPSHSAPDTLLGQNIEAGLDSIPGLLSNRLDDAKPLGPPDPLTGIAPDWRHNSDNTNEVRCQLLPGAGISGYTAAMDCQSCI